MNDLVIKKEKKLWIQILSLTKTIKKKLIINIHKLKKDNMTHMVKIPSIFIRGVNFEHLTF